ncbi:MAG: DUF2071 domain-containing protein [Verrucomicrobia bacterium]|nr:DUF2071 domain-containing protein [Verrucomicrobiota bacterium]MCH8511395.1 DUF2071 domain-containing protein [Kiritimatiellia bacterium]
MNPKPPSFPAPELARTDHRPWPLPDRPWLLRQQWNDLLFLHWAVDPDWVQKALPEGLQVDTHDGKAWLGIVPFDMKGVTFRGCPAPPVFCDFPEINLRTYVTDGEKAGVWFFSLDVNKRMAVWGARTFFHLPYFKAEVETHREGEWVRYWHSRGDLRFEASYRPAKSEILPQGEFEEWATSRYALYCQSRRGAVYRGEIHHTPWPLQSAEVEIQENTLLDGLPIGEAHPSRLFSRSLNVVVYPLEKLSDARKPFL